MNRILIFILVLTAVYSAAVTAQDDDPITGSARFITTVQPEVYIGADDSGNQSWVREYDSEYHAFDIGELDSVGFTGPWQYDLTSRELLTGQYLIYTSLGYQDDVSANVRLEQVLHRLDWIPTPEPGIDPPAIRFSYNSLVNPVPTSTSISTNFDDISVGWRLPFLKRTRLVGDFWAEKQDGNQQIFWFGRTGATAFQRVGSILQINRYTSEPAIGFDSQVSPNVSLSYRFLNTDFDGSRNSPFLPGLPNEPIGNLREQDTTTNTNDLRLSANLNDSLNFTGYFTSRNRNHKTAGINAIEFPATLVPVTSDVEADITTGTFVFDYVPSVDWYVKLGQYRSNYHLESPAITDPESGGIMNQAISTRDVSTFINANYSGIPRWMFGIGYNRLEVDRSGRPPHGLHEEFSHALFFDESDHNIIKFDVTGRPTNDVTFRLTNKWDDVNVPGYRGTGEDIYNLNANVVYSPTPRTAVNVGWLYRSEKNDVLTTLPIIPPPTDPAYEGSREFIAGAGYDNTMNSLYVGIWQALNSQLSVDFNYGLDNIESSSLWVLGLDPAFLPHLPPFETPFEATSNVYNLGLTYDPIPRWRFRANYMFMDASGQSKPNIFQLTRPGNGIVDWRPLDLNNNQWSISAGYMLDKVTQLDLEYTAMRWEDQIDSGNNGRFSVITLAAVRQF